MNDKDLAACREAFKTHHERESEEATQGYWVGVEGETFRKAYFDALTRRQPEIDALKAENAELKTKWLSPETYQTLMQERVELLHKTEELQRQLVEAKWDAKRWQYWRRIHEVGVVTSIFGNGCVNKTIEAAETHIDAGIAQQGEQG